ncbi:MAG: D-erythronate dehydrogenase [Alphaproteobacteria bacterium]
MRVLIIGGAGMIGRKLAARLVRDGHIAGQAIDSLTLHDIVPATVPEDAAVPVKAETGDLPAPGEAARLFAGKPHLVFHLAAVVSGQAEQEFDLGYRINMDGTRAVLEAARAAGNCPRVIFASSLAAFGAPLPDPIGDEYITAPLTSYGTQKAIGELLISDYTRKGFVDGLALRLPTICVRPGKPNAAASGFFSAIIREPLAGQDAVLPVSDDVMHWHASPRAAVGFLLHAAALDGEKVGARRALTLPGVAVTVGGQIAALRKIAGDKVAARIRRAPDPFVQRIIAGWPRRFDTRRALDLGFEAESSFEDIVRVHIEDELGGVVPS